MTFDELDAVVIVGTPDGALYDIGGDAARLIVAPGSIDPAYFNLLRSVSLAHVALRAQIEVVERITQCLEECGLDAFVPAIMSGATAANAARTIAVEGIEVVHARHEGNRKT